MIFKTITDESTGAVKSVGLFGKTLKELKSSFANIKTNGLLNSIFKTSSIDTKAIDAYNKAITEATKNNVSMADKQQIMQTAMGGTNKETARLIQSTQGNIVKQKQLKAAQDATTLSAKAGQVALKGLAMAGNMIAMWAISEVIGGVINYLDELSHKAQNIAEEAESKFSESNEQNETYKENIKSLDEYKQRYQEILNSNDSEIDKRKSLIELQGNINNLIGAQCDGLDLVNGKVDEQLAKIKKIKDEEKKNYYLNSIGNYNNAKNASNSSTGQEEDDGLTFVYQENDPDENLVNVLKENGYEDIYSSSSNSFWRQLFSVFTGDNGSINVHDGIDAYGNYTKSLDERVEYLRGLQETLLKNGLSDSELYNSVTSQIEKWDKKLDNQKKTAEDVVKSYVLMNANSDDIKSVEDYQNYVDDFIDKTKKDVNVSQIIKDGMLNDEEISSIVESYISVLDGFSEWYDKWKNNNNASDKTAISFDEAWESLDNITDDKSSLKDTKKDLLELAKAGKLTVKAFNSTKGSNDFLAQLGITEKDADKIEKIISKINDMVASADQLASMKSGISSISSILGEKKENLSNKKTKNEGIGADTLSGMPDDVKSQADEYENFVKVLGNGASTMQQCRDAANNLATAYVNSYNFLSKLTPETVGYYTSVLKQMGVENASEVVTNALAKQTYALRLEKLANSNATKEEITALQEEASQYGITSTALANYVIQKRIANNNALDTSKSISNLIKLAKQCGATSNVVIALQNLLKSTSELESLYQKDLTDFSSNAATDLQHAPDVAANEKSEALGKASAKISANRKRLLKLIKDSTKIGTSVKIKPTTSSGSGSGGSKGSSKNTKTEINWLERRLTRMQSIIDLTASKLQNLFSVKAKNNNLDKQIKQTTKLMNQYKIAVDRYMKKANSVAKSGGLSKDIIKKVQSGEITKASYSKLIKKYGQKKADKINSYIDYYDKAQDAKKNAEDQKAKIREYKIDKQTNIQEKADAKSSKYQTQRELAKLGDKNTWIKLERASTEESYEAQIKAAELQYGKKSVEVSKLTYEKKKALLDLYQEEIDNIKANAEAKIQSLENGVVNNNGTRRSYGQKYYQNQISLAEARGNKVNKDWYRQQSAIENQKISEYTSERNQLIAKLSGLTEGTTEWYNLQADIQACDDSINESLIAQAENTKAMRELTEKMEQEYDDWFSNLNNEISFISSLASGDMTDSDKGTFTDAGNLAMYSQSLLFQSSNAEKEYWKTQTNKLQKLIDTNASVAQIQAAGFEFNSIEDANDALTSYRQNWQDAIKEEKQAEEEIINLMKERYEAEKDYLQDIVDAKKEALSVEKDLYDYERNIADKTKDVATLQKRIISIRNDTSEEGRARLSKLQVELDSAQKDLQDTEYDRYISEQQNMLDNMMSQYEDLITKLQKNTDKILKEGFNYVNTNLGSLTTLFQERAQTYDYQMSNNLSTINQKLNDGSLEIISKNSDIAQLLAGESGTSENNVISLLRGMAGSIIEEYKNYETEKNTPPPTPTNNGDGSGNGKNNNITSNSSYITTQAPGANNVMKDIDGKTAWGNTIYTTGKSWGDSLKGWLENQATGKKNAKVKKDSNANNYSSELNKKLAKKYGYVLSDKNGGLIALAKWLNITKSDKNWTSSGNVYKELQALGCFKTGGIARLIKAKGEDGLMIAKNGEGFVSPENVQDIKDLMKVVPDMSKFISSVTETPNIPITRNNQPSNSIGEVLFNIDVNPKDFPDFVSQLQNEKRVQQVFSVAVNDLTQKGKITNNIQRY